MCRKRIERRIRNFWGSHIKDAVQGKEIQGFGGFKCGCLVTEDWVEGERDRSFSGWWWLSRGTTGEETHKIERNKCPRFKGRK